MSVFEYCLLFCFPFLRLLRSIEKIYSNNLIVVLCEQVRVFTSKKYWMQSWNLREKKRDELLAIFFFMAIYAHTNSVQNWQRICYAIESRASSEFQVKNMSLRRTRLLVRDVRKKRVFEMQVASANYARTIRLASDDDKFARQRQMFKAGRDVHIHTAVWT